MDGGLGTGRAVINGVEKPVSQGDVLTMKAGVKHSILADKELQIIEVQLGKGISVHDKIKYEECK